MLVRRSKCWVALTAFLAVASAAPLGAQTTISTLEGASPFYSCCINDPRGRFYGQSFQAPDQTNHLLRRFSLQFAADNPVSYVGRLMEFNPEFPQPLGPVLFESAAGTTSTSLQTVAFSLGSGVLLDPSKFYMFFVQLGGDAGNTTVGFQWHNAYANGMALSEFGSNFQEWPTETFRNESSSWGYWPGSDLAFEAQFDPAETAVAPEPVSMVLLGTGLGAVGAMRRRRKRVQPLN